MFPLSLSSHPILNPRYVVAVALSRPLFPAHPPPLIGHLFEISFTHALSLQYIGLQILEKLINTKWKTLPEAQRHGMFLFTRYLFFRRVYRVAAPIIGGVGM